MRLNCFTLIFLSLLLLSACSNKGSESELGAAPEYVSHEALMTRNPVTGEVEREKLWAYLLSQKATMGKSGALHKRIVYPNSWEPIDDFFSSLAVQRLVYDPNNTQVMYFCTGEGWNNADAARGGGRMEVSRWRGILESVGINCYGYFLVLP